ncbi:MAG: hypothetical protein M1829_005410 [Trizodia sp. TS-e1964]|nr:MAG: hypothetical protein M1829_005410 [Trizodia sp. TS-e1964]
MPFRSSSTFVPLICSICPSTPKFSDISHLLTHVSSKAHLSYQNKTGIRAHTDDSAREKLALYNCWYQDYGIAQLLSDRLTAKELKKARARVAPNSHHLDRKPLQPASRDRSDGRQAAQQESGMFVKEEPPPLRPDLRQGQPNDPGSTHPPLDNFEFTPQMYLWQTTLENINGSPKPVPMQSSPLFESLGPNLLSYNDPPTGPVEKPSAEPFEANSTVFGSSELDFDDLDDLEGDADSKLKGIMWPGMSMFDSATATMRRMRNQKKDSSVLEQMKINSTEVEPTELIFTCDGLLKKERRLSGFGDESPIKRKKLIPRMRETRPKRVPLAELNTNTSRIVKPKPLSKTPSVREKAKITEPSIARGAPKYATRGRGTPRNIVQSERYVPSEEENFEFQLTFGTHRRKTKEFSIYQDPVVEDDQPPSKHTCLESGPDSLFNPSNNSSSGFGDYHALSFLNSEFQLPSSGRCPENETQSADPNQRSIVSFFRPIPTRPSGKENIDPGNHKSDPTCYDMETAVDERDHTTSFFTEDASNSSHFFPNFTDYLDFGSHIQYGVKSSQSYDSGYNHSENLGPHVFLSARPFSPLIPHLNPATRCPFEDTSRSNSIDNMDVDALMLLGQD